MNILEKLTGKKEEKKHNNAVARVTPAQDMETDARVKEFQKTTNLDSMIKRITKEDILKASQTLRKYKDGKAALERRIINNEQWWKHRHWEQIRVEKGVDTNPYDEKPVSAWLFNCLMSKHADYMDAYPEPNILPREPGDKSEAEMLSHIVPVILEQNQFEKTYSDKCWYKLIKGGAAVGIFWDTSKLNGLGDITVKKIDILNLFWEPGITNIQDSENVFHTNLVSNSVLERRYPELKGKLGGKNINVARYLYDENIDQSDKSIVVDWYYHTEQNGRKILQYVKYVNDIVLYATENDTERPTEHKIIDKTDEKGMTYREEVEVPSGESMAERGWYDHGLYPFVCETDFPVEGSLFGFALLDICKDPQYYIDVLDQAILKNARMTASPRWAVRTDSGLNEEEFADFTKPFVHFTGNLGEDAFRQIETRAMNNSYINILNSKVEEMKETSGNRDVANGGTVSGVTSGSAISALQESAGKTSRDQNKSNYRSYSEIINMVIELIRQFYDIPRQFRIIGKNGQEEFITYSNEGIKPHSQGNDFGIDMGMRAPVFDIEVSAQKQNPYSKMAQNELALQFYNAGFFNPQLADPALACLGMMDFKDKNELISKIQRNSQLLNENMSLKQTVIQLATQINPKLAQQFAMQFDGSPQGAVNPTSADVKNNTGGEHPFNERARKETQEIAQPR